MKPTRDLLTSKAKSILVGLLLITVLAVAAIAGTNALAKTNLTPEKQVSTLHPTFPFLDENGENVLDSGLAVSTMNTCGACHDTDFIADHSFHASVGLDDISAPGELPGSRPWDTSPGYFGKWNPLNYGYLSPQGDERIDLTTAGWIMEQGARHVGGGPAVTSRSGEALTELKAAPGDVETSLVDPKTGELVPWDWEESGVVEMNCFLCHTPTPNTDARNQALHEGAFGWANTATLLGSGIVAQIEDAFQWNPDAFQEDGELAPEFVQIQDPTNENCGLCHGLVHDDLDEPLVAAGCVPERYRTITTGQIISGQKLSDTGMNIEDKQTIDRSWDIHAERLVECTDCHFSLNNPVYFQEDETTRPDHLTFDPRRLEINEYLQQPLHQFARGQSAQSSLDPELNDTMRRCDSCHSIESTHDWLPYKERHTSALSCESCHIPKLYSNTLQQLDWTVINLDGTPHRDCRGIEGDPMFLSSLITGYEPVLMPRQDMDGNVSLAPHNLITSWFWVSGNPVRPVRLQDLQAAWLEGQGYHPEVLAVFDQNGDGNLDSGELAIDSHEKEALIASRLVALGLENPRIVGEIQPYSINHDVTHGEWATQDCQTCHSEDSRIYQPFQLASYIPGDVMPAFVKGSNVIDRGELYMDENGALYYQPLAEDQEFYILGRDNVSYVDLFGALVFMGTLLAILTHGSIRLIAALRHKQPEPELRKVYMYGVYERLWHWLQTFVIVALLFTGLIIHKPDIFRIFSFRYVVLVHNILAAILVINAGLSLFYHLASGEIKQFIPRPYGFFDQAISQALFYARGIFSNAEHPFEKTPEKKLNPLQQATYFAILNILLPLQILTGILMWGAQRWPNIAMAMGGLPLLGPFHTLIAWLFASFIVGHVYLTTTGPIPLASIKAMMVGWDDVEVAHSEAYEIKEPRISGTAEEEPAV